MGVNDLCRENFDEDSAVDTQGAPRPNYMTQVWVLGFLFFLGAWIVGSGPRTDVSGENNHGYPIPGVVGPLPNGLNGL